jgi:uncharacterized protein (DUF488 family)
MLALLRIYKSYASFFEEAGVDAIKDFQRLLDDVDETMNKEEFIDRIIAVNNVYERLETFCRKQRRRLPPTILTAFKADITNILETIPLLTP